MADRSQKLEDDVVRYVAKVAKRLDVQVKSQMFDESDLIPILSFSRRFKLCVIQMALEKRSDVVIPLVYVENRRCLPKFKNRPFELTSVPSKWKADLSLLGDQLTSQHVHS